MSLWSSGRGSATWWSYWRRRWTSLRSCRCSSECAGICRTPCAPGGRRGREHLEIFSGVCVSIKCLDNVTEVPRLLLIFTAIHSASADSMKKKYPNYGINLINFNSPPAARASTSNPNVITAKHPSEWTHSRGETHVALLHTGHMNLDRNQVRTNKGRNCFLTSSLDSRMRIATRSV